MQQGNDADADADADAASSSVMLVDERPENLLSALRVDDQGWLRLDDDNGRSGNGNGNGNGSMHHRSDSLPKIYPSCEKFLNRIKFDPRVHALVHEHEHERNSNHNAQRRLQLLQNLEHVSDVPEVARRAIEHVLQMTKRRKSPREKRAEKAALEKELASIQNRNGINNVEEWKRVAAEITQAKRVEAEDYTTSECTLIVFNTIRVLLTVLLPVVNHPHRNNADFNMSHGPSKAKANNAMRYKNSHYMFFPNTYSLATEKAVNNLQRQLVEILSVVKRTLPSHSSYMSVLDVRIVDCATVGAFKQELMEVMQNIIPLLMLQVQNSTYGDGNGQHNQHHQHGQVQQLWQHPSLDTVRKIMTQRTLWIWRNPNLESFSNHVDRGTIVPLAEARNHRKQDHDNAVYLLWRRLSEVLGSKLRGVKLDIYGSCLSDLSLGNASDVDISLFIPEAWDLKRQYESGSMGLDEYRKKMKKFVYKVHDAIDPMNNRRGKQARQRDRERGMDKSIGREFANIQAVPFARVPVIKGTYLHANNPFSPDGSISFDICILNDIAVANSSLLKEYSLLDPRVRMLMLSVKSWIKTKDVGSAAENTLSSYTWMIMVIFYLQVIDFVPVLQCPYFMEKHGKSYDPRNRMHTINGFRTAFLKSSDVLHYGIWKQPVHFQSTPVSVLLAGFFVFYARHFPMDSTAVSIRLGNLSLQKSTFKSSRLWRLCVEDPFETHDSHYPHDLGTPMNEPGQSKVNDALREAAKNMEDMLESCVQIYDCIGSGRYAHVPFPTYRRQKTSHKKRRNNNNNQHHVGRKDGANRNVNIGNNVKKEETKAVISESPINESIATQNERQEPNILKAVDPTVPNESYTQSMEGVEKDMEAMSIGDDNGNDDGGDDGDAMSTKLAKAQKEAKTQKYKNKYHRKVGRNNGGGAKGGGKGNQKKGSGGSGGGEQKPSSKSSSGGKNKGTTNANANANASHQSKGQGQEQSQKKKKINYRPKGNRGNNGRPK